MSEVNLHRSTRRLDASDRSAISEGAQIPDNPFEPVSRADQTTVGLVALRALGAETDRRIGAGVWVDDRSAADKWLAPWFHHCLRVDRRAAGDRSVWEWLACTIFQDYVLWRWAGEGGVADNRWFGPVNKQALARLWWGAELFRDGPDYSRVERVFVRQDFPNSLLHRPIVRVRPFALGIVDALFERESVPRADEVNDVARLLNLMTAGSPPEAHFVDSAPRVARETWQLTPAIPSNWGTVPDGPLEPAESEPLIELAKRMVVVCRDLTSGAGTQ